MGIVSKTGHFIKVGSTLLLSGIGISAATTADVYAFSKLKSGFETITQNYLMPLSTAVACAAIVAFATLSFFRQEEYTKKVGMVAMMFLFARGGMTLINELSGAFS